MSDINDDIDEFANPFDEPAETETSDSAETDSEVEETKAEETGATEAEGEAEAEQSATKEESEAEESKETDAEDESTDGRPDENASNADWAKWRREQAEARRQQRLDEAQKLQAKQQEYLKEAQDDDVELRLRQMETSNQQKDLDRYYEVVENNVSKIENDWESIQSDESLAMFHPSKKESFNQRQFDRMKASYEAMHVRVNPNRPTDILGVNESFYKFAKEWAKDWQLDAKVQQAKGAKTQSKSISRAEPSGNSVAPQKKQSDPLMELWESDD